MEVTPDSSSSPSQTASPTSDSSSGSSSGDFSISDFMADVSRSSESTDMADGDTIPAGQSGPVTPSSGGLTKIDPANPPAVPNSSQPDQQPQQDDQPDQPDAPELDQFGRPKNPPRDFTGLNQEEQNMFKRMSYRSYQALYPIYKAYKDSQGKFGEDKFTELQTQLDEARNQRFWDEQDAWTLAPEYRELSSNLADVKGEAEYWQGQLASIREGKGWRNLYRSADGTYSQGPEQPASAQAEAQVMVNLQKAFNIQQNLSDKVSELSSGYKSKYDNIQSGLKAASDKAFGGVDFAVKYKPQLDQALQHFPKSIQHRQEIQMLAKSKVIIDGLMAVINNLKQAKGVTTNVVNTARNNGPGSGAATGSNARKSNGNEWEEFQKLTR